MNWRAFTASLLLTSFLTQPLAPLRAGYETLEDLEKDIEFIKQHSGSLKLSLGFKAVADETAAGCFNYAFKDKQYHVLLGLRDDQDTWCTPGGKSKAEEATLAHTASQEGAEETFNLYAPHPDALNRQTFVDLLTLSGASEAKNNFLFRLYFTPVEYLEAELFNSRLLPSPTTPAPTTPSPTTTAASSTNLPNTTAASSADLPNTTPAPVKKESLEYRKFQWVPVRDLLQAVEKGSPVLKTADDKTITLFDPLYQILTTSAGKEILGHLANPKKRPLPEKVRNRLYVAGAPENHIPLATHWELPAFDPQKLHDQLYLKQNFKDALHQIGMHQDAFGRSKAVVTQAGRSREEDFKAQKNQKIFGQAVAFKAVADLELKARFQESASWEKPVRSTTAWTPPAKTLSDRLLQLQLGKDYMASIADTPAARREADMDNLKKYITLHGLKEGEMKRKIDIENTPDIERLADVLENERRFAEKGWIALFHAAQPDVAFLPLLGTGLRQALTLQAFPAGSIPGLRQTDIYFRGHPSMAKSMDLAGTADYTNGNANRRFCANLALTAGLHSTSTSSNSVEYFMNAHSVQAPYTMKCFEEAVHLLGVEEASYLPYQALYEQFLANRGGKISQSALITFLVNPDTINTYAYPAFGGGRPYEYNDPATGKMVTPNVLEALALADKELDEKLEKEATRPSGKAVPLADKKVQHIAEVRFLLHPDVMYDPTKIQVYGQDRFPLTPAQKKALEAKLRTYLAYDLGTWLGQHAQLLPDSFTGDPALKKLYATIYTDLTGQTVQETLTAKAFPHLVRNGHTDGVKLFWESYPALVKSLNLSPKSLALMALKSGSKELTQYIVEDVLHTTPAVLFQPSDMAARLRIALLNQTISEADAYLAENYDLTLIPLPQREALTEAAMKQNLGSEIMNFIHKAVFPITLDFVDQLLQKSDPLNRVFGVASLTHLPPLDLADCLLKQIKARQNSEEKAIYETSLRELMQNHPLPFADILPSTGEPLLFSALHGVTIYSELLKFLEEHPEALAWKNKEGLTPFQYVQKCLLAGQKITYLIRSFLSEKLQTDIYGTAWAEPVYLPILEEFGQLNNDFLRYYPHPPFAKSAFLAWRQQLRQAMASNSLKAVKAAFEAAPDPKFLDLYALKNPTHYLMKKNSSGENNSPLDYSEAHLGKIMAEIERLIAADDYASFFPLIDQEIQKSYAKHALVNPFGKNVMPFMQDLKKRVADNLPPVSQEAFFDQWDLSTQREEFIQKAKEGKITPAIVKRSKYLSDENIDLAKETVPFIYKNPQDLLKELPQFYFQHPQWVAYAVDYIGADVVLKNIPLSCLNRVFDTIREKLPAIENTYPDLLTYQGPDRDLFPFFLTYNAIRDVDFAIKHLKRLKETYNSEELPLIYNLIIHGTPEFSEKMVAYDPSLLLLTSKEGIACTDLIAHVFGEDSEEYQALMLLKKKYAEGAASSKNG